MLSVEALLKSKREDTFADSDQVLGNTENAVLINTLLHVALLLTWTNLNPDMDK